MQPEMDAVLSVLRGGWWVHLFPEGTRGEGDSAILPLRQGVGRLLAETAPTPLLLCMHHRGLGAILPRGSKVLRVGRRVSVRVDIVVRSQARNAWTQALPRSGVTVQNRAVSGRISASAPSSRTLAPRPSSRSRRR